MWNWRTSVPGQPSTCPRIGLQNGPRRSEKWAKIGTTNWTPYQVNLFFEGSDDDVAAGIHSLDTQDRVGDNEGYYTLQGIRLTKPAGAGIYIHQGKKIIIK